MGGTPLYSTASDRVPAAAQPQPSGACGWQQGPRGLHHSKGPPEPGDGVGRGGGRVNSSPRGSLGQLMESRTRTNISRGTKNPWGGRPENARLEAAQARDLWRE